MRTTLVLFSDTNQIRTLKQVFFFLLCGPFPLLCTRFVARPR